MGKFGYLLLALLFAKTEDRHKTWIRPHGDCWLYRGTVAHTGYGELVFKREKLFAHRVAYQASFGDIPDGMCVCHKCDEKLCVNPMHYFLGTDKENHDDCVSKRRHAFGSRMTKAKLTDDAVIEIRNSGLSGKELAAKFNVSPTTISEVIHRKVWKHV